MAYFPLVALARCSYNAVMCAFPQLPLCIRSYTRALLPLAALLVPSCGDDASDRSPEHGAASATAVSAEHADSSPRLPDATANATTESRGKAASTAPLPATGKDETIENDELAQYQKARAQYEKAREWAQKASDGSKDAFEEAVKWTEKAATNGYREAQMTLAALYFYGHEHLPRDAARARQWFEEAAHLGSAEARYYLGVLYALGDGVKKSLERASEEWKIAAREGVAEAQYQLGMISIDNEKTLQEGLEWLRRAADHAQVDAALALGKIYARGKYSLGPDMKEAAHWYRRAAEEGNLQAQYVYSLMCLTGSGVPRDDKQGMSWLQLAAGRDYLPAAKKLAECYRKGEGTEANPQLAEVWEQRAAEIEAAQNAGERSKPEHGENNVSQG